VMDFNSIIINKSIYFQEIAWKKTAVLVFHRQLSPQFWPFAFFPSILVHFTGDSR
jgi:hypothetical protein